MWIAINRENQLTLARQVYEQIRGMILSGALHSGQKLLSTRELSSALSVSRNTVIEAYGQLIAEGYLQTYQGSGTRVAEGVHAPNLDVSPRGAPVRKPKTNAPAKYEVDFRTGIPALECFPRKEWGNLYREICASASPSSFGYCDAAGVWELREVIAQYLYRARGVSCDPGRIVVTSGSTQGLFLASRMLRDERKQVLMEDPSHPGLRKVIASADCRLHGVPVDDKGLRTELLGARRDVAFVYTTPSHQYPLGGVLPIQRRLELIRYAEREGCHIVEDDYDSEFRFEGQPVGTLYELNPQRVIYLGSFSKILAPALRLGFMILPDDLLPACKEMKAHLDVHTDAIGQRVLAHFIRNGGFERHIWKMKKRYAGKRSCILNELSRLFGGCFDVLGHATGLHLVVQFREGIFTEELVGEIAANGVRVYRAGDFYLEAKQTPDDSIVLGYSHLSPHKIAEGIEIIGKTISSK